MTSSPYSRHEIFNKPRPPRLLFFFFLDFPSEETNFFSLHFSFFFFCCFRAAVRCLLLMFSRSVPPASVALAVSFRSLKLRLCAQPTLRLTNKEEKKNKQKKSYKLQHILFKGQKKVLFSCFFCVCVCFILIWICFGKWFYLFEVCCNGERFTELLSPLYVI